MAIPVIPEYKVDTGKSLDSGKFGFYYSAKLARTLAETLYQYKYDAIAREYATNITDAHVDALKPDLAGYIHIPTKFEPYIDFTDYGNGMDAGEIFETYTVFGLSTKDTDNTTNGSLGYGAKSAFSLYDQFIVTSVKDGVKTVVLCYKDKNGEPSRNLKSVNKTDEASGTTIRIPVSINSVSKWVEVFTRVLGAFRIPHKTNIGISETDMFKEISSACAIAREEGHFFSLHSNLGDHLSYNKMVLMGDVLYSLPSFDTLIGKTKIKGVVCDLMRDGDSFYIANFNIGEVDHAPSRESISYDSSTLAKVKLKVNSDIKYEYHKIGLDSCYSPYLLYKSIYGTPLWEAMYITKLPVLNGLAFYQVDPNTNKSMYNIHCIHPLSEYGRVQGIIKSANDRERYVFSSAIDSLDQFRIFKINKPLIVYSEIDKGLYRVNKTLGKIKNSEYKPDEVLYCKEGYNQAVEVAKFFGVSDIICGDTYSDKRENKGGKKPFGGYGIKSDYEILAKSIVFENSTVTVNKARKIDVRECKTFWAESPDSPSKYIKPFRSSGEIRIPRGQWAISAMLKASGLDLNEKVVVIYKNSNNAGKIERSGLKCITDLFSEVIKNNKDNIIDYLLWEYVPCEMRRLGNQYSFIIKSIPRLKRIWDKIKYTDGFNDYEGDMDILWSIINVTGKSVFGETKSYQKGVDRKDKFFEKLQMELRKVIKKAPLLSYLDSAEDGEITRYLKLEKLIK